MGRRPYYRKACRAWYVLHDGKQVRLGRTRKEADAAWHRLVSGKPAPTSRLQTDTLRDEFLAWCEDHRSPATVDLYRRMLASFIRHVGQVQVSTLKPFHVTRWLTAIRYGDAAANLALRSVLRCFNWGVREGFLSVNPVAGAERPPSRPRECYVTHDQWEQVLNHVAEHDPFRDLLLILWHTGCRPMEARTIEARFVDPSSRSVTFPRVQSKGKRKQRVVVLNSVAMGIVERLGSAHPAGPLLRNEDGNPWCAYSINCRFRRLKAKLGFNIFAYAIRHTWATNALLAGVEPLTVATLMGHASINMIWQTYQKLQMQSDHMRAAAEQATQINPPSTQSAIPQAGSVAQPKDATMLTTAPSTNYTERAESLIESIIGDTDTTWKILDLLPQLIDGTADPFTVMDRDRLKIVGAFAYAGVQLRAEKVKREEEETTAAA